MTDPAPRQSAFRIMGRLLVLRLQRTKGVLLGRSVAALDEERMRIRAAFIAQLDAEADDLAARSRASRDKAGPPR